MLTRGVKRKLRAGIVGACAAVAVVCAVATGSASAGDGPVGQFKIDDAIRMVVKYYEGIPTNHRQQGDSLLSPPSLLANRAVLYNDSQGNCTIGWGHLVVYPETKTHPRIGKHRCNATDRARYGEGWTFSEAAQHLDSDIDINALEPLNRCVHVALTPGQVRALVGLLYQTGPNRLITRTIAKTNPKTKKVVKLIPCQGSLALALNSGKFDLPALIRRALKGYKSRAEEEVWDATDGKQGQRRPAAWRIATAIEPRGAVGTIKITPTGAPDSIDHVAPAKTTRVCATTEGADKNVEKRCGPFDIDEQVSITASTKSSKWRFVGWKAVDDDTGETRDLCAKEGDSDSCTVNVRDQLVRAIAVFRKSSCPTCKPPPCGSWVKASDVAKVFGAPAQPSFPAKTHPDGSSACEYVSDGTPLDAYDVDVNTHQDRRVFTTGTQGWTAIKGFKPNIDRAAVMVGTTASECEVWTPDSVLLNISARVTTPHDLGSGPHGFDYKPPPYSEMASLCKKRPTST